MYTHLFGYWENQRKKMVFFFFFPPKDPKDCSFMGFELHALRSIWIKGLLGFEVTVWCQIFGLLLGKLIDFLFFYFYHKVYIFIGLVEWRTCHVRFFMKGMVWLKRVLSVALSVCKKVSVWLKTAKQHVFQAKLPSSDYLIAELNVNKLWKRSLPSTFYGLQILIAMRSSYWINLS